MKTAKVHGLQNVSNGLEIRFQPEEFRLPHVLVGQRGRGSWAGYVPVGLPLINASPDRTFQNCSVVFSKRRSAQDDSEQLVPTITAEDGSGKTRRRTLVHIAVPSPRHDVGVALDPGDCPVIAHGWKTHAKTRAEAHEILVVMEPGDVVYVSFPSARAEDSFSELAVHYLGGVVRCQLREEFESLLIQSLALTGLNSLFRERPELKPAPQPRKKRVLSEGEARMRRAQKRHKLLRKIHILRRAEEVGANDLPDPEPVYFAGN